MISQLKQVLLFTQDDIWVILDTAQNEIESWLEKSGRDRMSIDDLTSVVMHSVRVNLEVGITESFYGDE
ncbi:hypothetical protein [Croceibacterium ferulae]|uniref:hypothetical protein n=1 Tax=Croceibacterium ferulae TaxID=1854641 RepID=UPI000EB5C433|nr:hypothetical protein [Croceibacterium ferulae]